MVICLELGASDLRMVPLMLLPLISCFVKIQVWFVSQLKTLEGMG